MAPKKKAKKHSFTPEVRAEAMRLCFEERYTAKQAAEAIGCSTNAIQKWKAAAKSGKIKKATAKATTEKAETAEPAAKFVKKVRKTKRGRKGRRVARKTVAVSDVTVTHQPPITFDAFAHDYWNECAEAMDVMQLPPDLMPKAIQYVNNVLRYAYDQFYGR